MASNLTRAAALVAFAFIHASASAQTRPVNDTGVISCTNESWAQVTCESVNSTLPGQDAVFGRDAMAVAGSLTKTGIGSRGFDFTKIGNDGVPVPATALPGTGPGQYRCARDNTTGLVWENYTEHRVWRDPNPATNGGFIGAENVGNTTDAYVSSTNASARCNRTTWRLPTVRELLSFASFASDRISWPDGLFASTLVDRTYYWTSQTNPAFPEHAFTVNFFSTLPPSKVIFLKEEGVTNKTTSRYTVLVSSQ